MSFCPHKGFLATTSCKSTWDTVPYVGINGLSMILCLWSPLHPLPKLLAIEDHTQNLGEQLWMGGRREEGGWYYISQTCDQERFAARKVIFSWECLNVFATGCSTGNIAIIIIVKILVWRHKQICSTINTMYIKTSRHFTYNLLSTNRNLVAVKAYQIRA